MTKPSKERPISEALQLQGKAEEIIRRLDTPEKCAEFFVNAQESYEAIGKIMRHATGTLLFEAKERPIPVGAQYVSVEPKEYSYDIEAVKELAPECIKTVEVPTSDKMQKVCELLGPALEQVIAWEGIDVQLLEDRLKQALKLAQPEVIESVDANKLRGVLGRGDQRAQQLMARKVKSPLSYKLVIREGGNGIR